MSNSILPTTTSTLASALLKLGSSSTRTAASDGNDPSAGVDLDSLQLSGSSISDLEEQAQEIAAQNQNSVIGTSEEALAVNLQAVALLGGNGSATPAAQSNPDPSTVLSLVE